MQINAKGDTVKITLTQSEGRAMRSAGYIAQRIASNLPEAERTAKLRSAAQMMIDVANEFTPEKSVAKLDREDEEEPDVSL